jgi:ATP-dependent Clp protease ATP-binding subunit ClpA
MKFNPEFFRVDSFKKRLKEAKDITIEVTLDFMELLLEEGYEPTYGARPLHGAVTSLLEEEVAQALLEERIKSGDTVIVDVDERGKVKLAPMPMPPGFGSLV